MDSITVNKPTSFQSFTRESNAKIVFSKIPTFEFLTQKFVIPGISASSVNIPMRSGIFNRPGDVLVFEKPWTIEILLDENYIAYLEIFKWIMSYASTDDDVERDFSKITTDAKVVVLDNNNKEIGTFTFNDVYPIALGSIEFSTTSSNTDYMKFNAAFEYSNFIPTFT
jgi:hypothetical protein